MWTTSKVFLSSRRPPLDLPASPFLQCNLHWKTRWCITTTGMPNCCCKYFRNAEKSEDKYNRWQGWLNILLWKKCCSSPKFKSTLFVSKQLFNKLVEARRHQQKPAYLTSNWIDAICVQDHIDFMEPTPSLSMLKDANIILHCSQQK